MNYIASIAAGYLMGAFPTGYLVGRYFKGIDVRDHGSGNIGFTNVLRVVGPFPAALVLIGDVAKGALATYVGLRMGSHLGAITGGGAALVGHSWPVYIGFRGGKMVAAGLGVLATLDWKVALTALICWLAVLAVTRYVSLASIIAAVSVPVSMLVFRDPIEYILFGFFAASFILFKHKENIKRLRKGNEYKIGEKPKPR